MDGPILHIEGTHDDKEKAGGAAAPEKRFSLAEVAAHSFAEDFWTVIDDVVYDMSGYVAKHPGGSIILLAAGTDSTVMFHQYHMPEDVAVRQLRSRRVGVLKGKQSPKMGRAYPELKRRIAEALKHEPKRPQAAVVLFLLDLLCLCALLAFALYTNAETPRWQLSLFTLLCPIVVLRLFGQSHALGHMHLCHASSMNLYANCLLALAAPGIAMFAMPEADKNPRELMNECRVKSQDEFLMRRGPGEHQGVHHVKGAELEHDECYQVVSMFNILRISAHQRNFPHHRLQRYRLFHFVFSSTAADVIAVMVTPLVERVLLLKSYFIPQRLVANTLASLVGIGVCLALLRTQLLLPWLHGMHGLFLYLAVSFFKSLLCHPAHQLLYGQHKWDHEVDEDTADQDWGMHNAESSMSVRGMEWHPICWGMAGASPSSLTYHLEHTLFPGLCYLHLPKIAPVVQATLAEFGVTCTVLQGGQALQEHYTATMDKYADLSKRSE